MKTYRIKKENLKNKKILATGYKIFGYDWKSKSYDYKDENGEVLGTFHKVNGDIIECKWGLHFSKNPFHCFNFYEAVQWNRFAKVNAYEKCIDSNSGDKSIAKVIEIVEIYTFNEFIEVLKEYNKNLYMTSVGGNDISRRKLHLAEEITSGGGNNIWRRK